MRQSDDGVLIVHRGAITKQMRYYTFSTFYKAPVHKHVDVMQTKENASDVRQSDDGVLIVRRGAITKQMRYYT